MPRLLLPAGLLCLSTLCVFAQNSPDAQRKPPLQLADYEWERDAQEWKLTPAQISTLKKQGFVVTNETYRQVFTPYLDQSQLFITSDSLINGYAVLLEDAIFRLESQIARYLETFLREAWPKTQKIEEGNTGDEALLKAASERAKIVVGVAYALATGDKIENPPAVAGIINEETRRVETAAGRSKPAWLGAPDEGFAEIDYTRFKPRGFYAGNPALERYFRATAWLQAIPFRFDKDQEFAAYLLLYRMIGDSENKKLAQAAEAIRSMQMGYEMLVGASDTESPFGYNRQSWPDAAWNAALLADLRKNFARDEAVTQINDQIAVPAANGKPERSFRLLAAYRTPDTLLFARTEEARGGMLPSGLEVAASMGSSRAAEILKASRAKLLQRIEQEKPEPRTKSLYDKFLDALAVLLRRVDSSAPALFHSTAWEEKSLQTFLGGWAQARHAWVLQSKQYYMVMGMTTAVPSCFAEPVPDFYNKMGQLAGDTDQIFSFLGAYSDGNLETARQLRASAQAWRRYADQVKTNKEAQPDAADAALINRSSSFLAAVLGPDFFSLDENPREVGSTLEKLADQVAKGELNESPRRHAALNTIFGDPKLKWNRFMVLCFKVESLSHRQLKGQPLTQEDEELGRTFGEDLADIMFYEGNFRDNPFDDAPKIVDIAANPRTGQILHAGIGRPRQIFVLYPYEGKEILTHGAVMPYYEFPNPSRLTDKAWIDLVSSPDAPAQPNWLNQANGTN